MLIDYIVYKVIASIGIYLSISNRFNRRGVTIYMLSKQPLNE